MIRDVRSGHFASALLRVCSAPLPDSALSGRASSAEMQRRSRPVRLTACSSLPASVDLPSSSVAVRARCVGSPDRDGRGRQGQVTAERVFVPLTFFGRKDHCSLLTVVDPNRRTSSIV